MGKHFDYHWTCPEIDKNIKSFQSNLSDTLDSIVKELNPLFYDTSESVDFLESYRDLIYDSAETYFENVRDCNSTMRDEVENVIGDIIEERDEYKRLSEEWESEAEQKDREIEDLREDIENLKYQIETLKEDYGNL